MLLGQLTAQGTQGFPLIALFATDQLAGLALAALDRRGRLEVAAQLKGHFAFEQGPAARTQAQAAIPFQVNVGQASGHQLSEQ
jgi:hypothetical protein